MGWIILAQTKEENKEGRKVGNVFMKGIKAHQLSHLCIVS
jgi:hypothetical protein